MENSLFSFSQEINEALADQYYPNANLHGFVPIRLTGHYDNEMKYHITETSPFAQSIP